VTVPPRKVYVVDDDEAVRDALRMLFRTAGLDVQTFRSAAEFLERARPGDNSCLVLDIRMPGMTGAILQEKLIQKNVRTPVIFITGHGDIPMAVEAIKKGAFDFVEKPFDDERLLRQVLSAMDAAADPRGGIPDGARERLSGLSSREREVLERVLEGKSSRQVGEELFISTKTVEFHRARIMGKLGVRSMAQLFRVCLTR
jgi:FixJ family two-component response regulator